jgi:hypothetical protein
MSSWKPSGFDPKLVSGQIVAVQSLGYVGLGMWLLLLNGLAGRPASAVGLGQFFSHRALRLSHPGSWATISAFLLNALAGGAFLCLIVERAKKCLDFAATFHILHLCGCVLYDGFPDSWVWWIVNVLCLAVTAVLGEYLCMRREMREIPLRPWTTSR